MSWSLHSDPAGNRDVSQKLFNLVPDSAKDRSGKLWTIYVDGDTPLIDQLPVLSSAYDGQLLHHPRLPRSPILRYAEKDWVPIFSVHWKETDDKLTVARLEMGAADSFVVAQFAKRDPQSSSCALLVAIGLLPISAQLDKRLVLRVVRGTQKSSMFALGLPLASMKYLRNLSAVTSVALGTAIVPSKDKTAMAMVRFLGYAVAGRGKLAFAIVQFRDESEFDQWTAAEVWRRNETVSKPDKSMSGLCAAAFNRQWKALNELYSDSCISDAGGAAGVRPYAAPSHGGEESDGEEDAGLEMHGIAHRGAPRGGRTRDRVTPVSQHLCAVAEGEE
jgi:hypothetical protein